MNLSITFQLIFAVFISMVVFFLGLQFGKERASLIGAQLCSSNAYNRSPTESESFLLANNQLEITPRKKLVYCPPSKSKDKKLSSILSAATKQQQPQLCHRRKSKRNMMRMIKGKSSVPEDIFPFLHHPASPAKLSFFFTHEAKWKTNAVLSSPCQEVYMTRTGSRASQPNKCVAVAIVPNGFQSINQQSHRVGYTALNTDQYQQDYPRDYHKINNHEQVLLHPLLRDLSSLLEETKKKLGNPIDPLTGKRKTVIVMVANEGVMDLLMNFMCSAQGSQINLKSILVFVGDERYINLIENMGGNAIYSPSLGSMPSKAAGFYLDGTFSRMMWFKTTSVYLALTAGFEVLFQDVDLVWLKDPFSYFDSLNYDLIFMDDGARTPRYTPFFVNSGFYFVKYNERTLYMFEKFMKHAATEIGQTHSHQSVLIRHISEAHHLFGLKVYVLDGVLFPSGQAYHENKPLIRKIQKKAFKPYVFHMCWTDNRENKLVYFKDVGLWYLPETDDVCTVPTSMLSYTLEASNRDILDRCCLKDLYWPPDNESSLPTENKQ